MKKYFLIVFIFILLVSSCKNSTGKAKQAADNKNALYLIVGSYAQRDAKGISVYRFDTNTGDMELTSYIDRIANPTYLAVSGDERYVYSVAENEKDEAAVYAYAFDKKKRKFAFPE